MGNSLPAPYDQGNVGSTIGNGVLPFMDVPGFGVPGMSPFAGLPGAGILKKTLFRAIISHENDVGILSNPKSFDSVQESLYQFIHVADHADQIRVAWRKSRSIIGSLHHRIVR